jgi:hypothetical protein
MWIRSQDKTVLKNCNEIHINNKEDNKELWCSENGLYYFLGAYLTGKRAFEVLDEIQDIIMNHGTGVSEEGTEGNMIYFNYVYEMPEK